MSQALHDWAWTWNASEEGEGGRKTLPRVESIRQWMGERAYVGGYVFQLEQVSRYHYQGKIRCTDKKAKSTLLGDFQAAGFDTKYLTFLPISNNGRQAAALDFYCTKIESRVEGPWFDPGYTPPARKAVYEGKDLACMDEPLQWQSVVLDWLESPADDRSVRWIWNEDGNAGANPNF